MPAGMDARELKREGWYAWVSDYENRSLGSSAWQKRETEDGLRVIPAHDPSQSKEVLIARASNRAP
jgi:hypothetical protein